MLIEVPFHELVKKINVWNRGEGLGMAHVGSVGGPTKNDNTVGWQAGNCYIFVNTWDKSTTLVELHLINAEEPANDMAIRTWRELHRLIEKEYQAMPGSLELGESSTDASRRAWYEYKLKANFEGFETELDQFITAYSESELETIELSPWQNLIENRFIERIVVPRNHERVRILSIRFRFRDRATKGLTTEEGDITLLVSYIGATDGYNLLLTVLPGFLRAKPFVESWISRCKRLWAAISLDATTTSDTLVEDQVLNKGVAITAGEDRQPAGEGQIAIPARPEKQEPIDKWFDYYHQCKQSRIKYTLKDLASDVNLTYGYVRQKHSEYLAEHVGERTEN